MTQKDTLHIYTVILVSPSEQMPPVSRSLKLAGIARPNLESEKTRNVNKCAKQARSCCGSSGGVLFDGRVENR